MTLLGRHDDPRLPAERSRIPSVHRDPGAGPAIAVAPWLAVLFDGRADAGRGARAPARPPVAADRLPRPRVQRQAAGLWLSHRRSRTNDRRADRRAEPG